MSSKTPATERPDLQFCWEQVLRIRPQFRISHPYAPREISTGLLAMHALLASFEEAVACASDEVVSRTKLAWWQEELLGRDIARSQHPIVRVLHRSIELPTRIQNYLQRLLGLSLDRVESAAPVDEAALLSLCGDLGYNSMRLEFALEPGGEVSDNAVTQACIAAGLLQLLRESARNADRAYWWLPLNLLARSGISRSEFVGPEAPESTARLMEHLYSGVLGTRSHSAREGATEVRLEVSENELLPRHRHWSVQSALHARLLSRLKGLHPQRHASEFSKNRLVDVWTAWRSARNWSVREGKE